MYITSYKTYEFERKLIYKNIYKYTAMTPSRRCGNPFGASPQGYSLRSISDLYMTVPIAIKKMTVSDIFAVIGFSSHSLKQSSS